MKDKFTADPVVSEESVSPVGMNGLPESMAVQRRYEAIVADFEQQGFGVESAGTGEAVSEVSFGAGLGSTLWRNDLLARFEGVKENLVREIRGGMCTFEQAFAYLENLEISLLLEQEASSTV